MLSRIAESLFWIGRYVERADSTARILDVHVERTLADPWIDESAVSTSLLSVMGSPADPERRVGRRELLETLAYDPVSRAPSPGRWGRRGRTRDGLARRSPATCGNRSTRPGTRWRPGGWRAASPHRFFSWVRERTAVVSGLVDATMSRDDSWQFFVLGRSLERADMTARLVDTRAVAGSGSQWPLLLRSRARTRRSCGPTTGRARGPRANSTRRSSCCWTGCSRVRSSTPSRPPRPAWTRSTRRCGASGTRGRAPHRRDGPHAPGVPEPRGPAGDLHHQMRLVTEACSAASEAVAMRFFPMAGAVSWTAGRS